MLKVSITQIKNILTDARISAKGDLEEFDFPETHHSKNSRALVFFSDETIDRNDEISNLNWGAAIMTDAAYKKHKNNFQNKTIITTNNPKLAYAKLHNKLTSQNINVGIFGKVDPTAKIGKNVFVGDGSYIGPNCEIGDFAVILPNAILIENIFVGHKTKIGSGTVLGGQGFGYVKDEKGRNIPFPQIGGVFIGDHVEIGSNTTIDSGALTPTYISSGVKIDNLVHIAHGVEVGENTIITAGSIICGSVKIGADSWIAPGAIIMEHLEIGKSAFIGIGSVVTKNIKDHSRVAGFPARELPQK